MLQIARGYVGEGRLNDRAQVARFLQLFGLPYAQGGAGTPYCASFVSWCAAKALAELKGIEIDEAGAVEELQHVLPLMRQGYFLPSPSVTAIAEDAMKRGTWVAKGSGEAGPDPGWLICYDFGGCDRHIGIVGSVEAGMLRTVEGNTCSGGHAGMVAEKQRTWAPVWGFVRLR